jgi:hypothetical protein
MINPCDVVKELHRIGDELDGICLFAFIITIASLFRACCR